MKTVIYYGQAEFILGMQIWLNIQKSNNIFYLLIFQLITELNDKTLEIE